MADTAYDADHLRQAIAAKGALAVIPDKPSRALKYPLDKHLYAQRHLVECCLSKLKQFRRVATRCKRPPDITATSSLSQPSSYGCGKCPHHLALFNAHRVRRDGPKVARADRSHSFGVKQMGARDARNPHVAYGVEGAGNVVWVGTPGPQRRASPRRYR